MGNTLEARLISTMHAVTLATTIASLAACSTTVDYGSRMPPVYPDARRIEGKGDMTTMNPCMNSSWVAWETGDSFAKVVDYYESDAGSPPAEPGAVQGLQFASECPACSHTVEIRSGVRTEIIVSDQGCY